MNTHSISGRILSSVLGHCLLLGLIAGMPWVNRAVAAGEEPALFLIHQSPYAQIRVTQWVPGSLISDESKECRVLFGVNSRGEQTAWPQGCPEDVAADATQAAKGWSYRVGSVRPGEIYARFEAVFVYPAGEPSHVLLAAESVEREPSVYPPRLVIRSGVQVAHRPQLQLKGVDLDALPRGQRCEADVRIAANGKPLDVNVRNCSEELVAAVAKYVGKWRWRPLRENGEDFTATTTVVVRIP